MSPPEQPKPALPNPTAIVLLVTSDETLASRVRAMLSPDRTITLHASQSIGDAEIEALEIMLWETTLSHAPAVEALLAAVEAAKARARSAERYGRGA